MAQITAEFAPLPGLCLGAELLCGIIELCENVTTNRYVTSNLSPSSFDLLSLGTNVGN